MADDPGKEPLDSNTNDQPDPPKEIIPVEDTETIPPIQQTENMEVHKHPHHVTHKKKWPEYLLEFFMLFLYSQESPCSFLPKNHKTQQEIT